MHGAVVDFQPLAVLEQQLQAAAKSEPGLGDNRTIMEDYEDIRRLSERWQIPPKKFPFQKFVISCLGTTSAGKSSFINHFYRCSVKKSAVGQLDTHFTVIETVSPEEFTKYSPQRKALSTALPSIDAPLNDVHSDPRYGTVFVHLDTMQTLARYSAQFALLAKDIASYGLVSTVLINEQYLPKSDLQWHAFATKTIFIDSPGFDPALGQEREVLEKFLGNLKILQFIFTMSDHTLFFVPATQLNMVASQLGLLELSVLYSIHGADFMQKLLKELNTPQTTSSSWFPTAGDLKDMVMKKLLQEEPEFTYKGNSVWDKIKFVMSKIDEILINGGTLSEQYYELGRLFGRHLTHMEPPTFSQCVAIGLPRQGSPKNPSLCGDLDALLTGLSTLTATSSFEKRLNEAMIECCGSLQLAIQSSWGAQWYSNDLNLVQAIQRRAQRRLS